MTFDPIHHHRNIIIIGVKSTSAGGKEHETKGAYHILIDRKSRGSSDDDAPYERSREVE